MFSGHSAATPCTRAQCSARAPRTMRERSKLYTGTTATRYSLSKTNKATSALRLFFYEPIANNKLLVCDVTYRRFDTRRLSHARNSIFY